MEKFGRHHQLIIVPNAVSEFIGIFTRVARHYPIHQGIVEGVGLFYPLFKITSQFPKIGKLQHALFQGIGVFVDQLAGNNGKSTGEATFAVLKPFIEQLGKLSGEGIGRFAFKFVILVKYDTRFSGVGNNGVDGIRSGQFQVGVKLCIGINAPFHYLNQPHLIFQHTVVVAVDKEVIQPILGVDHAPETFINGLHQHHFSMEQSLLVHHVEYPIYKSPQEVSFSELNYF